MDRHHPVWRGVDEFFWNERPGETEQEEGAHTGDLDPESTTADSAVVSADDEDGSWPISLGHTLSLSSVVPADQGEYFTNYTAGFKDILDYIFVSTPTISVVRAPVFPSVAELSEETAIPSSRFPSDHVALITDVQFR